MSVEIRKKEKAYRASEEGEHTMRMQEPERWQQARQEGQEGSDLGAAYSGRYDPEAQQEYIDVVRITICQWAAGDAAGRRDRTGQLNCGHAHVYCHLCHCCHHTGDAVKKRARGERACVWEGTLRSYQLRFRRSICALAAHRIATA